LQYFRAIVSKDLLDQCAPKISTNAWSIHAEMVVTVQRFSHCQQFNRATAVLA
jgi:hypothetical protein